MPHRIRNTAPDGNVWVELSQPVDNNKLFKHLLSEKTELEFGHFLGARVLEDHFDYDSTQERLFDGTGISIFEYANMYFTYDQRCEMAEYIQTKMAKLNKKASIGLDWLNVTIMKSSRSTEITPQTVDIKKLRKSK